MYKKLALYTGVAVLLSALTAPSGLAATQSFFTTSSEVRNGMLVSLTRNKEVIEPAHNKQDVALLGVAVPPTEDTATEPGKIAVQVDGVANVLVSTLGGDIKVGDKIAPSSVVGFGQKFAKDGWVVGTAQESLTADTEGTVKTSLLDSAGGKHEVYVKSIPVQIKVTYIADKAAAAAKRDSPVPDFVQQIADSIAGKRASTVAVVLSFMLLISGLIVAGMIVVTAVRGGLRGIARQPLARQSISHQMLQAFGIALAIIASVNLGSLVILRVF